MKKSLCLIIALTLICSVVLSSCDIIVKSTETTESEKETVVENSTAEKVTEDEETTTAVEETTAVEKTETGTGTETETGLVTDCDHTALHAEQFDFSTVGACSWILYYNTCECGEVKIFDIEKSQAQDSTCDFEFTEVKEYVDENGNKCATAEGHCTICGLESIAYQMAVEDGCTVIFTIGYTFIFNGVTVIENVYLESTFENHDPVNATIELSQYGACGGTLIVQKCANCDKITGIDGINADCGVDFEQEPETEEVTDENGIVHYIQRVECPKCHLEVKAESWTEVISQCESTENMVWIIRCGDNIIYEYSDSYTDTTHEYEYSYVLDGETCDDGYTVNVHCPICGDTDSWSSSEHIIDYRETNLAQYGLCGVIISEGYCTICGTIKYCDVKDYACNWVYSGENEDGYPVYECGRCGATKVQHITESESTYTETVVYFKDGEEVYRYEYSHAKKEK